MQKVPCPLSLPTGQQVAGNPPPKRYPADYRHEGLAGEVHWSGVSYVGGAGTSRRNSSKQWKAQISFRGAVYCLGCYEVAIQAAAAYDDAAWALANQGGYRPARFNFPHAYLDGAKCPPQLESTEKALQFFRAKFPDFHYHHELRTAPFAARAAAALKAEEAARSASRSTSALVDDLLTALAEAKARVTRLETGLERQRKEWPVQPSGNRFEYRTLDGKWQVYGAGLVHVCMCEDEMDAARVTKALNDFSK